MKLFALAVLCAPLLPISTANAQTYGDLDSTGEKRDKEKTSKRRAIQDAEVVREIERGFYAVAPIGSTAYLGTLAAPGPSGNPILRPGTYLALGVGQDFVDQERLSMAWEVSLAQGLHNGEVFSDLASAGYPANQLIQGDTRTITPLAMLEMSFYPIRRWGIGLRAGGGMMFTPYLVNAQYFEEKVGQPLPPIHATPHPVVQGGPCLEIYTKLSHLSVGINVDIAYAIGWDLSATGAGYFKYTF
jgi:hypothetical protein